ncbi:MAG TPA: hypothetical protein VIE89_14790 [Candidatus Binatia bacterium]|jgi:hypothetical protein
MRDIVSRVLAAIELAALLIPTSGRALLATVLVWVDPFGKSVFPVGLFVLLLIAIAAIAALWRILGAFMFIGGDCFATIHRVWWWLTIAGVAMVIASLPLRLSYRLQFMLPDSPLTDFVFYVSAVGYGGTYLLIPLAHVSIERWRRTRSAHRLETTVTA